MFNIGIWREWVRCIEWLREGRINILQWNWINIQFIKKFDQRVITLGWLPCVGIEKLVAFWRMRVFRVELDFTIDFPVTSAEVDYFHTQASNVTWVGRWSVQLRSHLRYPYVCSQIWGHDDETSLVPSFHAETEDRSNVITLGGILTQNVQKIYGWKQTLRYINEQVHLNLPEQARVYIN